MREINQATEKLLAELWKRGSSVSNAASKTQTPPSTVSKLFAIWDIAKRGTGHRVPKRKPGPTPKAPMPSDEQR